MQQPQTDCERVRARSGAPSGSAQARPTIDLGCGKLGRMSAAVLAALSVTACTTTAMQASSQGSGNSPTTSPALARLTPTPLALSAREERNPAVVPPIIAQSLSSLVSDTGASDLQGSIALRELELSPNGPRALVARGEGRLCEHENCPIGIFEEKAGMLRPILLVMGSTEPWVHPVSHLGRPDLSMTSVDTDASLRLTRYRWNGTNYAEAACLTVERRNHRTHACLRTSPDDVPVLEGSANQLCGAFLAAARTPADALSSAPLATDAFLIRRDARAHVQGMRLEASEQTERQLQPLVNCMQRAGFSLKLVRSPDAPAAQQSVTYLADHRSAGRKLSIALSSTTFEDKGYALVTLGVFAMDR